MASRLSSLLVHDGLVSVKQMSEAFQRQVIYGGALDTIILEMGILGEVPLTAYLAQAAGLPPATPELLGSGDPVARGLCALEVAEEHHAVPLSFEGEALRLLVADPVDIARLEALATRLQRPVQPYVTPEFRVHEALQAAYALPMPPRFDRLAGKFGRHVPAMPLPASGARVSQKIAAVVVADKPEAVPAQVSQVVVATQAQLLSGPAAVTAPQAIVAPPPDEPVVTSEDALRASLADMVVPGPAPGSDAVPLSIHEMATQQLTPLTRDDFEGRLGRTTEQGFAPLHREDGAEGVGAGAGAGREPSTTMQGFAVREDGGAIEADVSPTPTPTPTPATEATDVVHPEEEMDGEGMFVAMGSALGADAEARLARAIEAQLADAAERMPEGRIPVATVVDDDDTEPTVELTAETEGEGEAAGEITVNERIPNQGVPEYSVVLRPSGPHLIQPGVPVAIHPASGSGGAVPETVPPRPSQKAASWRHRPGADAAPMPASAAIARLDQCEERDEIFEVIARGARSRLDYVAVLTAQGGTASGRLALEGDSFDVSRVAQVGVPLDAPSALRTAHETASPYVGPLVADDRVQAALYALGDELPMSALVLPIVLKNRVIGLLYGYARRRAVLATEVTDLLPMGAAAGAALGRLILKVKSGGFARPATQPPGAALEAPSLELQAPPPSAKDAAAGAWRAPTKRPTPGLTPASLGLDPQGRPQTVPPEATQPTAVRQQSRPIAGPAPGDRAARNEWPPMQALAPDSPGSYSSARANESGPHVTSDIGPRGAPGWGAPPLQKMDAAGVDRLLDKLEDLADARGSQAAARQLMTIVDEVLLPRSMKRFPGRLMIDRYSVHGRVLRASQHGPLLAMLVQLGERATPWIVGRLVDPDREVRYYATVACAELAAPSAASALAARLFDPDYAIRTAAVEALGVLPSDARDAALEPVRKAAADTRDPVRARSAVQSLGELRDVLALPALLVAVGARDNTLAEASRRALVELTKQDFGTTQRKWQAWWDKNRGRHRIEWMLDGLAHRSDEVRMSASEELKRVTGEYFGYHYDLPRRERDEAHEKWLSWWESVGRRRFVRHTTEG